MRVMMDRLSNSAIQKSGLAQPASDKLLEDALQVFSRKPRWETAVDLGPPL
jgi:hypothetical protein